MRIGLHTIRLLAPLALVIVSCELFAQSGGGSNYCPPQFSALESGGAGQAVQAMYMQPMGCGPADQGGGYPIVVPAQYCGDCADDGGGYGDCNGDCYDGGGGCGNCGGECGYGNCYGDGNGDYYGDGNGYGAYGGHLHCDPCHYGNCGSWQDCRSGTNPPFPDDVENYSQLPCNRTEQCGPHYFDVRMEAVYMTRDETFRQQVDFTSNNVDGPIVLSSGQLDFEPTTGFRIIGRYDCGPLSVIEFGYWGIENLDSNASFTDPDPVDPDTGNLFSLFTNFVRNPALLPATVTTPGGALPWTERSITHSISLESELHNGEFNYRRYWVGFNPTVSGTLLAGFRFTRLREDFRFQANGEAQGRYDEGIKNDMAGFQAGGDVWIHLRQGVRIGAEGKVGVMDNHYTLDNTFSTNPVAGTPPDFTEHFQKDIPALIADGSADLVWDVCPSWSVRVGYEVLFLNSVLLAGENFNTGTVYNGIPGVLLPQRVPFVNDQGNAFYHGAHLGAEYTW